MNKEELDFLTFCVGAVALSLKIPRTEVFARLKKANLVDDYIVPGYDVLHTFSCTDCYQISTDIVPGYDVLHTFSRQYIVEDIIDMMKRKGVL